MKDEKFTETAADVSMEQFVEFFENKNDFNDAFDVDENDRLIANTRRGLREIMRFGDIEFVRFHLAKGIPVAHSDIDRLKKLESREDGPSAIDLAHAKRDRLHDLYKDAPREFSSDQMKEYSDHLQVIIDHRRSANQARLTNHTKAYQLTMSALSKLMDFTAMWERDWLFLCHAWAEQYDAYEEFNDVLNWKDAKSSPTLQRYGFVNGHRYEAFKCKSATKSTMEEVKNRWAL